MAQHSTIVVDGATGYVGNHLTAALCSSGHQVKCIVHPGARECDMEALKSFGAELHVGDLSDEDRLYNAMSQASVAVHLIGSIAPRRGERLKDLHAGQTRSFIKSCRKSGIEKVVMVTALGTAAGATSVYHATKWQAEELVRSSKLNHVILRPSLLIGRQIGLRDSKLVCRLMEFITNKKMLPLVAGGTNRIQPLFIGDLVKALTAAIQSNEIVDQTLELGGLEVLTMREFAERLMQVLQIYKPVVALPTGVARGVAFLSQALQSVPVLSQDQVTLSVLDNICIENAVQKTFGIHPVAVAEALETYRHAKPAMERV